METEPQIAIGDYITDMAHMIIGPVVAEAVYPLREDRPGIPCWEILNIKGLTTLIFKYDAELVRKADR